MFSTLLGPLPPDPDATDDGGAVVVVLEATGLELVSDGGEPAGPADEPSAVVARWAAAASAASRPVKVVLLGPWSATRSDGSDPHAAAEALHATVMGLAAAGCPFVEIVEPDAAAIATDSVAAAAFGGVHRRAVDGVEDVHCSLAITGASVDGVEPRHLFDAGYASYAFDLIGGPDNWRLVAQAPADRGIVCGALGFRPGADETREVLVWAAHYAASTNGRGLARVGLANAPTGEPITRAEALRKLAIVAEASRIAAVESGAEMAGLLDPRAIDIRSAAMGRFAPDRRRRRP